MLQRYFKFLIRLFEKKITFFSVLVFVFYVNKEKTLLERRDKSVFICNNVKSGLKTRIPQKICDCLVVSLI